MKILVIEDNPSVQFLFKVLLERIGHRVDIASLVGPIDFSGYDAILADHQLMGYNKTGEELMIECAITHPNTIRAVVTGYWEQITVGPEIAHLVKKPFSLKRIMEVLETPNE